MGGETKTDSRGILVDGEGLAVQDLAKLDVNKLTPLSPEVISREACGETLGMFFRSTLPQIRWCSCRDFPRCQELLEIAGE